MAQNFGIAAQFSQSRGNCRASRTALTLQAPRTSVKLWEQALCSDQAVIVKRRALQLSRKEAA